LRFDANPRTLEPPNSAAGFALRTITEKMPGFGEQLLIMLDKNNAAETHDSWMRLQEGWGPLVQKKELKSTSMLAGALTLDPENVKANMETLAKGVNFSAARAAFTTALEQNGAQPMAPRGQALLDRLEHVAKGQHALLDWRTQLPEKSPWWF